MFAAILTHPFTNKYFYIFNHLRVNKERQRCPCVEAFCL